MWDIKNGELESVRKEIENKVEFMFDSFSVMIIQSNGLKCVFPGNRC